MRRHYELKKNETRKYSHRAMLAYAHLHKRECKQGHEAVTTAPLDQSVFEIVLEFHAFAKLNIPSIYIINT